MTDADTVPEPLADLPPAPRHVYREIERTAPVRFSDLQIRTGYAESTLSSCLRTLQGEGLVEADRGTDDLRERYYSPTA